jgi:hypothetical protein
MCGWPTQLLTVEHREPVLQRWCKNGGYVGGEPFTLDLSVPSEETIGPLCRFVEWYARGRQGEPLRNGGRKVCEQFEHFLTTVVGDGLQLSHTTCHMYTMSQYHCQHQLLNQQIQIVCPAPQSA